MSTDNTYNINSSFDRYRKNRPIDIVNTLYLLFIVTVYTFYMHKKYFDITGTRAETFVTGSMMYLILAIVSIIIEIVMINYFGKKEPIIFKDTKLFFLPEVWAGIFLLANVFAFLMSPDKTGSWTGETGRYFGLSFVIVLVLTFIVLSQQTHISVYVYGALFLVYSYSMVLAFLQHFGHDPFELTKDIVSRQKGMFISVSGNINTFGSYICLALPIFLAIFIFSEKLLLRIIAAVAIVESGIGMIASKSDNVYLGLGVAFVLLFYIAIIEKKFTEYIFSIAFLFSGLEMMALLSKKYSGSRKHINGIAEILINPKMMAVLWVAIIAVLVAAIFFRTVNIELYKKVQCNRFLVVFTILMIISMIAVVVLGVRSKSSFFVFNDKWGTYRGYIWRKGVALFKGATPMQKLFGYGNETIGRYMIERYYDEMIDVTGRKYDNLHCELLQYLVTTGLFGMLAHVGFVSTSFAYIGKRMKGDAVAIACLASGVGYFTQSLVNLNQPITTPFFYVVLAAGIGYLRYKIQGYGKSEDDAS
ncbi:MAG: O-antigen ligase family protein [Eubacterium sp.]|nr:O-antigen ligase family protein [Eubacterium sp.]